MKLGDLVQYDNQSWLVCRCDARFTKLATLQNAQGLKVDIAIDLDVTTRDCEVVANPSAEWPYLIVKDNPRGKFMVQLFRTVNRQRVPLSLYSEWVPSDPARPGGSIFLNPSLGVQPAETLIIEWASCRPTSVQVPVHFGTVDQKVVRASRKKPAEVTIYDRLLDDRFDEEG